MKRKKRTKSRREFWHKQFHFLHVDVFDVDVGLAINASEEEVKAWLKESSGANYKNFDENLLTDYDSSHTNKGRTVSFMGGFVVLVKANKKALRSFVGILCHELAHVAFNLLRNRATPLSEDTEETYAYLLQNLTQRSLDRLYS